MRERRRSSAAPRRAAADAARARWRRARSSASKGPAPSATTRCVTPSYPTSTRASIGATWATSSPTPPAERTSTSAPGRSTASAIAARRRWSTTIRVAGSTNAPVGRSVPSSDGSTDTTRTAGSETTRRTSTGSSGSTASTISAVWPPRDTVVRRTDASPSQVWLHPSACSSSQRTPAGPARPRRSVLALSGPSTCGQRIRSISPRADSVTSSEPLPRTAAGR